MTPAQFIARWQSNKLQWAGHFVEIAMKRADLSYALVRLGWTQVTFAEYSGYDRRTIGRWMSGAAVIPLLVERHLDLLLAIRDRLP